MAENRDLSKINNKVYENVIIAKLLLTKYGVLHSFHELQLQKYTVACCMISLGGKVEIDGDKKAISFQIYTEKKYKKKGSLLVERSKLSKLLGYFILPNSKYESELVNVRKNLTSWCRELLWDDKTIVKVVVDGKQIA